MFDITFDPSTVLKLVSVSSKLLRIFLESLRQSSVIYRNLPNFRKMFENVRVTFGQLSRSLVRYRVERLEIKSVSTRGHAISSITEIVIYRYLFFLYQLWSALNLKHNLSYHCLGYVKVILFPVICGESQMCS